MPDRSAVPQMKYPWQKAVFEALVEYDFEKVPPKIGAAERAISERLVEGPGELDEQVALRDSSAALRLIFPDSLLQRESRDAVRLAGNDGG
jgi:hypothetical protein